MFQGFFVPYASEKGQFHSQKMLLVLTFLRPGAILQTTDKLKG